MRQLLSHPATYNALQKVLGADDMRYRSLDLLELTRGETVVDIGCGPAYYLDRLPQPIEYHGFDPSERYIEWAHQRWGGLGSFHVGTFGEKEATAIGAIDAVLLLGVLHHLSDSEASDLLGTLARSLSSNGRIVSVDTCFSDGQGRISRWISENDRGEHVRTGPEFTALAEAHLTVGHTELLTDTTRLPGSFWMMRMTAPPA